MILQPPIEWKEVRGIFVYGCVVRGEGSSFRAQAHAHTAGDASGWICVRGHSRIKNCIDNGSVVNPNRLLFHEYAHIRSGHGHDDAWRKTMRELKQPIPERYTKRERGKTILKGLELREKIKKYIRKNKEEKGMKKEDYKIVPSKAIGGYSIAIGNERLSLADLSFRCASWAGHVGMSVVKNEKYKQFDFDNARKYVKLYEELERFIKAKTEERK